MNNKRKFKRNGKTKNLSRKEEEMGQERMETQNKRKKFENKKEIKKYRGQYIII